MLWVNEEEPDATSYGIKLCEALMEMCFKHDYTINLGEGHAEVQKDKTGVDCKLVWKAGACTPEECKQDRYFQQDLY